MIVPAPLEDEDGRLQELRALGVLDTADESLFDDIVELASFVTGCPMSMISLIDAERQWFKARLGLDAQQTHRHVSFCGHAIAEDKMFTVEDARLDERFADNPLVTGDPNIRFYAGRPLTTSRGFRVGTLCTLDQVPRKLSCQQLKLMEKLARQTVFLLERRRNEQALQMSKKNSRVLFDNSPAILLSMQGEEHRLEYVNADHEKFLGRSDVIGRPFVQLQPEARESGFLTLLDHVYLNGATQSLQESSFEVRGETRYFNLTLTPRYGLNGAVDGVMGIVDDITARKTMELQLQKLHDQKERQLNKLTHLLEQVPIHVAMVEGSHHRFVFANKLYREQFLQDQAWQGKAVAELFPESARQGFNDLLDVVFATGVAHIGKEAVFERELPGGQCQKYHLDFIYEAIKDPSGKITGVLAAIADVTEQVKARSVITSKVEALREEREIRERFVATLSHDLQNPLTAAKLAAHRLERTPFDFAKVQKLSRSVLAAVGRTEKMVRDLLDANRLKAGDELPISPATCDLNAVVKDTVTDLMATKTHLLEVESPPTAIEGYWDAEGIRRVLENLVGNAIKYGKPGAPIVLNVSRQPEFAQLTVHNEGPAIAAEELPFLFETYHRADAATESNQAGWGIGLALVKGIAQAHRGQVRVESAEGCGTTFFVQLPYAGPKWTGA